MIEFDEQEDYDVQGTWLNLNETTEQYIGSVALDHDPENDLTDMPDELEINGYHYYIKR